MPRRSPWAVQSRVERRRIIREHSSQFFPANVLLALEIRAKGAENIDRERKIGIVRENLAFIARKIAKERKLDPKEVQTTMADRLSSVSNEILDGAANIFMFKTIEKEKHDFPKRLVKTLRSYFKARKIPAVESDLVSAVNHYLRDKKFDQLAHGIDPAEIERTYFEFRKTSRWSEAQDAEMMNSYLHRITRGLAFTGNQKSHIKRWLKKGVPKHTTRRRALFSQHSFNEAVQMAQEMDKTFINHAREEFSGQFRQPVKKTRVPQQKKQSQPPAKTGTREQRLAAYTPRQREDGSKERAAKLKRTAQYSKEAGKQFNTAEYCLAEISRESEQTGATLRKLLGEGKLNTNSLVSLFTSGSLTQRTFLRALDSGFENRFGPGQISALAKGLAFIGPTGKLIIRAKRSFQTPKREEIFSFLEHNGLLETAHGGGKVVYLARSINH